MQSDLVMEGPARQITNGISSPEGIITYEDLRLPNYESTMTTTCLTNNYVISIKNISYSSYLMAALVNGQPTKFSGPSGDLADALKNVHTASVRTAQCGKDGQISVLLNGYDSQNSTKPFERIVSLKFSSSIP
ncbi:hypothetical protein ACLB0R_06825 [Sphingomonas sp. GlSt437]|uniref:hypothetical protein n=1 Tax=Sphingomonas sp. GlSt437 TaxID=3389970 RepID=UPI003EBEFF31